MDEATLGAASHALEQWGVAGAVVVIFLACLFAAYKLAIRWMDKVDAAQSHAPKSDKSTPTPGLKTLFTMRASEVKEEAQRQKEDYEAKLNRMEAEHERELKRLEDRINEAFRVMGTHREEKNIKFDKMAAKYDEYVKENTRQDRDMMNLSTRLAAIEGKLAGIASKTGLTHYHSSMPPTDISKDKG